MRTNEVGLEVTIREGAGVGEFRDDINMVIDGHIGRVSYAEAIGVLFGVASDLAREAREENERRHL